MNEEMRAASMSPREARESGIKIPAGGYSGTSGDFDDPTVTPSASVERIAWFANPGDPKDDS